MNQGETAMSKNVSLPGLDRLISICRQHSLPLELSSPFVAAPQQGEKVLEEPFDPQLAAVYQRVGAAVLGPISLLEPGPRRMDLISWNQQLRENATAVHFNACHVFGQEAGFSLYFGTVPRLAVPSGPQPVVYIVGKDVQQYAAPIASSVDRFFDLCSRYLELMVVDTDYIESGVPMVTFPWDMLQFISGDEPLMEQVRAGRFDFLTNGCHDACEWLKELLSPPSIHS